MVAASGNGTNPNGWKAWREAITRDIREVKTGVDKLDAKLDAKVENLHNRIGEVATDHNMCKLITTEKLAILSTRWVIIATIGVATTAALAGFVVKHLLEASP